MKSTTTASNLRRRSMMVATATSLRTHHHHHHVLPNRRHRAVSEWSIIPVVTAMVHSLVVVVVVLWNTIPSGSIIEAFQIPTSSKITTTSYRSISSNRQNERRNILPHSRSTSWNTLLQTIDSSSSRILLLHMLSPSVEEEEEWHPHDPAWTTPQLLEGIWSQIAQAKNMVRNVRIFATIFVFVYIVLCGVRSSFAGDTIHPHTTHHPILQESYTVIYPQMEEAFKAPRFLNLLFAHLDACKDVCDHFGITTTLIPYKRKGRVVGFTVQSFRNPDKTKSSLSPASSLSDDGGDANESDVMEFEYDPYWDDGTDFAALYDGIDDEDMVPDPYPAIENKIPDQDDTIIDITKSWVSSVMSDMGVCPFTQGAEKAGLPLGDVYYTVDRSSGFEDMYERYWKEVTRIEQNPERDISTILLITPEFCMDNLELFESFTNTLTQPLTALGIEDLIQLVFFHPVWSFRDGDARSSPTGQAANYARRSPWPMINLLRTSQVRTAQKGIPTGLVYKQNEKTLAQVGVDKLETMLRLRDWTDTADYKVNRREIDALKIAQDFQATGTIAAQDTSLRHDNTPAANKVDRRQVEQGNLVNVLLQALEKRLDMGVCTLTGPETSATALATDVLINALEDLISTDTSSIGAATTTTTTTASLVSTTSDIESDIPDDIARARQARMDAARRSVMEDLMGDNNKLAATTKDTPVDPMEEILFGRGGIGENNGDDDLFAKGMNPASFY